MTGPQPSPPRLHGLLLDLDGVVYDGERPLAGAAAALAWLRGRGVPLRFVSNTTSRPRAALAAKLAAHRISAEPDEILTPAVAAARWLQAQARSAGAGAGRPEREDALSGPGAGGSTEAPPPGVALFVPAAAQMEFAGLALLGPDPQTGAGCVVIGDLGSAWSFRELNRAFRLLMAHPHARLIALGMTRYFRAGDGLRLDVGPFVAALQHATGRVPLVFGKPEPSFFLEAVAAVGLPPHEVAMVGDDIVTDVAGAQRAGLRGLLVRTGKFQPADLAQGITPDAVLDALADLPAWWQQHGQP